MAEVRPSSHRTLVKIVLPLVVVAVLSVVFWQTVTSARRTPYTLTPETQGAWRLVVERVGEEDARTLPVLVLEPPPGLARELFDQAFKRSMESMNAPQMPGIPLVSFGEAEHTTTELTDPEALLKMARAAGLESTPPKARCIGHRRAPGDTRQQVYFAIFDVPGYAAFRAELAKDLAQRGFAPDPRIADPTLVVGVVESSLTQWLPLRAGTEDCVAPIQVSGG